MNISDVKFVYLLSCAVLAFIILTPTIYLFVPLPSDQKYTEFYLINSISGKTADLPFNLTINTDYSVNISTSNHMAELKYYVILVKLLNQSDTNNPAEIANITPISELHFLLGSNESDCRSFFFNFKEVTFQNNISKVTQLLVNNQVISLDKTADHGYYQLFFELWLYNRTISSFQSSSSVWLWLCIMPS